MSTRIRRIEFINFKAFSSFFVTLGLVNVAVGSNNSGKSTIVGAIRTLDAAVRFARSRPPTQLHLDDGVAIGYRIPPESVPISLENVQTDYNGIEARVIFYLTNGNSLTLIFPIDGGCALIPHAPNEYVRTAAIFKRQFPLNLVVVPVLGPVEHNERRRERSTVIASISTHRASRHFRSFWHYNPEGFDAFADLIARTWPGMSIQAPEHDVATGELTMFCLEGRMTRELYWVGFGFQIWCQLLTHLSRATEGSFVVVDEPEIYLHPDVQRQMLGIIRDSGASVLLATHSSEIISEADPTEIVLIDKRRRSSERLKDVAGVQRALEAVGSGHDITLTALARSRRILFVEGIDDFRLIRRFARKLGLQELSSGSGITPLESGGFGSWNRITALSSGIASALGAPLMIGALYDRDFFCDEQISFVLANLSATLKFAKVLKRKEIENYLLVPSAIDRAISKFIREETGHSNSTRRADICSATLLDEITSPKKDYVLSQLMARRHDYLHGSGIDKSTLYIETLSLFETRWRDFETRMAIVPGKDVLRELRDKVQSLYNVTLTDARIAEAMTRDDVADDMRDTLYVLESFRTAAHRE